MASLDSLPFLALDLTEAPEALLRRLFEITQLGARPHDDTDQVAITIRLPADRLPEVREVMERMSDTMPETQETPAQRAGGACVDAVCAPGAIRTHTGRVLNPLPLPLGYGGLHRVLTLRDRDEGLTGTPGRRGGRSWGSVRGGR